MKTKPILCPGRLRHVPRQFSWIDQRLVRDRHIQGRSPDALALYLFLCTVADAQGASYYADASAAKLLTFSPAQLRAARTELVAAGLIAWREPYYQVLSLESAPVNTAAPAALTPGSPAPPPAPSRPLEVPTPRATGRACSIGDIVRAMMQEAREGRRP
jgi:hypothetical protein